MTVDKWSLHQCPDCGGLTFTTCGCVAFWVWFTDDTVSDGRRINAQDPQDAAETFCENTDIESAEYTVAQSGNGEVAVMPYADYLDQDWGKVVVINVTAEQVVEYTASDDTETPDDTKLKEWGCMVDDKMDGGATAV